MAEPAIQFNVVTAPFGDLTGDGWNHGNVSFGVTRERANSIDASGNETAHKLHNAVTEYQQAFTASSATVAPTPPDTIGALVGLAMLTEISISTGRKFAEMSLTGHQHAVNAHADTLLQAAHGITLSKAFGAVDFMTATAGANATLVESTVTIRIVNHVDEMNGDGDHLVGGNAGGEIEITQVWLGVPTTPCGDATISITGEPKEEAVGGFKTFSYTGIKPLTLAEPA
jgi:hypothetical protein